GAGLAALLRVGRPVAVHRVAVLVREHGSGSCSTLITCGERSDGDLATVRDKFLAEHVRVLPLACIHDVSARTIPSSSRSAGDPSHVVTISQLPERQLLSR